MVKPFLLSLTLLFSGLACIAKAQPTDRLVNRTFKAFCLDVHDGDTMTVEFDDRKYKIRLADVDAPELDQDDGENARDLVLYNCKNRYLTVEAKSQDRYGRLIAMVYLPEQAETVQHLLICTGMAWVYRQYSHNKELFWIEDLVRRSKKGLWSRSNPVAPWVWRHSKHDHRPRNTVTWELNTVDS